MFDYKLKIDEQKCSGCGLCAEVCPILALDFDPERGKAYVHDISQCLICRQCLDVCPSEAVIMEGGYWMEDMRTG